jgi:hypothetical protein
MMAVTHVSGPLNGRADETSPRDSPRWGLTEKTGGWQEDKNR